MKFFFLAAVSGPRMAVFPGSFSESVPFLKQPANLDGSLPGDAGFDPLGFSEVFDLRVLREAELKHGRIAMLAALGYIVQEVYTFPFFDKVILERIFHSANTGSDHVGW